MNLHISPSLRTSGKWANEIKFSVTQHQAEAVLNWAAARMELDVNSQSQDGSYLISTLYLDTPSQDVYNKTKGYRVSKYRVRRYDSSDMIFLEQKQKRGCQVTKKRVQVNQELFSSMILGDTVQFEPAKWFFDAVKDLNLGPASLVSYTRTAFNVQAAGEGLRLTLDRNILAKPCGEWMAEPVIQGLDVSPERWVLEIKFPDLLPPFFQALLLEHKLIQSGFSKYRLSREALWSHDVGGAKCRAS